MNDKQLLELLAEANEHPPLAPLPEQIHSRSRALDALDRRIANSKPGEIRPRHQITRRHRGPLVAVAVFMTIIIVGAAFAVVLNNQSSSPPASTTSIPLSGTALDAATTDAFDLVQGAYAAHAMGDADSWFRAFFPPDVRDQKSWWAEVYATYAIAGQRFDVSGCISHGLGVWDGISADEPFFEDDAVADGYRFECVLTETNAFHDAGGIVVDLVHDWVVSEGVIVAAIAGGDYAEADAFNQDFRNWLLANHYEVFNRMETLPWLFPAGGSITTALEHVGQFVEGSPDWPRPPEG